MSQVHDNVLLGNWAAHTVAAFLSAARCLVRPVAADTDVGVDLYCETTAPLPDERGANLSAPFLHFWVQVKAGKQVEVADDSEYAKIRVKTDSFLYWSRQPVPVFMLLVPARSPGMALSRVYTVDLTQDILHGVVAIKDGEVPESFTLKSRYWIDVNDPAQWREFIDGIIPRAHAALRLTEGVIGQVPTQELRYDREWPFVPVHRSHYQLRVVDQIRNTAAMSILSLWFSDNIGMTIQRGFAKLMATVLAAYDWDQHYSTFMAIGIAHHANHRFAEAQTAYERATHLIDADPKLAPDHPLRTAIRPQIAALRDAAANCSPLPARRPT